MSSEQYVGRRWRRIRRPSSTLPIWRSSIPGPWPA